MKIYLLNKAENTIVNRINQLLSMLSPSLKPINFDRLEELISANDFKLFMAETESGDIAGMLSLTVCKTLTCNKYWIEDVVVDEVYRGKGIGRKLLNAAIDYVKSEEQALNIYLTSNPRRVAARNLYVSEGFEEYDTGVFRIKK